MNVTMQGLSEAEALTRLAVHGPNAMPEARPTALAVRVIAQFKSPLIYILLLALCLDVGLWADTIRGDRHRAHSRGRPSAMMARFHGVFISSGQELARPIEGFDEQVAFPQ